MISVPKSDASSDDNQIESCKPTYPISNFYMADVISKNPSRWLNVLKKFSQNPYWRKQRNHGYNYDGNFYWSFKNI